MTGRDGEDMKGKEGEKENEKEQPVAYIQMKITGEFKSNVKKGKKQTMI